MCQEGMVQITVKSLQSLLAGYNTLIITVDCQTRIKIVNGGCELYKLYKL